MGTREPFVADQTADLQVTTLSGAKGITAEHVYVLGMCQEAIPGARRDEYPGTEQEYVDEQRRLFYVSITRTKRTLVLSRPRFIG
ncbi:MAG TPA: 3'-5' exonuclease, partial [Vicinamibacterales bacterium]|nr:3'-5' exonuclease [Vicinamibacterales bacterium]